MIPRVKICGITNLEDAKMCINEGADALGFVFYEKSPRYITPQKARDIIKKLPPLIECVGLFVNEEADFVNETSLYAKTSLAQIHFEADDNFFSSLKVRYLRVIRANYKSDISLYENEYRLVDAFVDSYGGEGKRIESSWFDEVDCSKIILAGGLNDEAVKDMKHYGFYGYDVSSFTEKTKGKKDIKRVRKFIEAVKGL